MTRLRRRVFRREQLIDEGALIIGKANVAFAVGDANEKGGDRDVVGVRRGSFNVLTLTNCVSARSALSESTRQRISGSMVSPGYGSGSAESETSSTRSGRVESSGRTLGCVAQQSDAAVGDALRVLGKFRQAECFR